MKRSVNRQAQLGAHKRVTRRKRPTAVVMAALVLAAVGCAQRLDVTPVGTAASANDVNDAGWIVGERRVSGHDEAWVRSPAGDVRVLPGLDGAEHVKAVAINASGVVVGWDSRVVLGRMVDRALRWDPDGTPHDVGSLGGPSARAIDINDSGTIVGNSDTPSGPDIFGPGHPFIRPPGSAAPIALPRLPGQFAQTFVTAMNNAGLIVGHGTQASEDDHALKWLPGTHELVDMEPAMPFTVWYAAIGVNDAGDIVGQRNGSGSLDLGTFGEAVLWPADGGPVVSLGGLAGAKVSLAKAVAPDGTVVGEARANGENHAFRWDPTTKLMTDLGTLGGATSVARSINATGTIVGSATDEAELRHATTF